MDKMESTINPFSMRCFRRIKNGAKMKSCMSTLVNHATSTHLRKKRKLNIVKWLGKFPANYDDDKFRTHLREREKERGLTEWPKKLVPDVALKLTLNWTYSNFIAKWDFDQNSKLNFWGTQEALFFSIVHIKSRSIIKTSTYRSSKIVANEKKRFPDFMLTTVSVPINPFKIRCIDTKAEQRHLKKCHKRQHWP